MGSVFNYVAIQGGRKKNPPNTVLPEKNPPAEFLGGFFSGKKAYRLIFRKDDYFQVPEKKNPKIWVFFFRQLEPKFLRLGFLFSDHPVLSANNKKRSQFFPIRCENNRNTGRKS